MPRTETVKLRDTEVGTQTQETVDVELPNRGRHYENIKSALEDLPEIAESIERLTGWKLDVEGIRFVVMPKEKMMELVAKDALDRMGITPERAVELGADSGESRWFKKFTAYAMTDLMGAAYLPTQNTVVLSEDRFLRLGKDTVKELLHHELTHAAQNQAHPEFFKEMGAMHARSLEIRHERGAQDPEYLDLQRRVGARGALMEGQAMHFQRCYKEAQLGETDMKLGVGLMALGILAGITGAGQDKAMQYITGQKTLAALHAIDPRLIEGLFRNCEIAERVFSAKNGNVTLKKEEFDKLIADGSPRSEAVTA